MAEFDVYAFADYSGAASDKEQRRRIAWCVGRRLSGLLDGRGELPAEVSNGTGDEGRPLSIVGCTRRELVEVALRLLQKATAARERVLFGFDHNYSMPVGFYEAATGREQRSWRQMLDWLADELEVGLEEGVEPHPRQWAARVNEAIARRLKLPVGPFWGPHFSPGRRMFPFGEFGARLPERRLVETRQTGMKSAYQLGGAGSVGLQSLFGIARLRQLLRRCEAADIPLHCWPFDGWSPPQQKHVMVEVYPTLYLPAAAGRRTDAGDAAACVRWAREQDRLGQLDEWLAEPPGLTPAERRRAALEGWVLGVR
ncbi:hypothetical protein ACFFK0_05060 [Paenibacillus chartarius]|uniref:Uncharacterized protein n=1 Tax=Paenibacillus chartarius TaxID=747481 RepID=A0ABV6DGR1_9BACL